MGRARTLFLLAAAATLSACGTAEKRKLIVQPAVGAQAPQPLPLRSPGLLLRSPYTPTPDSADLLISQAESLYAAGMADFRSGNLEKAKAEFDETLSVLLGSKLEITGDDRLSAEFNKLVENIYGVEVAALERGDTLSPHAYEPAPIESFAGLTFPVDPKVKQRVQQEIQSVRSDLPLVSNDYVAGVITYFQNRGQGFMRTILKRVGLYQSILSEALRREGLPQDLLYLAAAESAFNPFALSRAGAKGIWQLMLGRAIEYGLKKDRWVDEREDPVKSTQAAVRHLKDLYQTFGDWHLAMAAYNCGPGNVQRAIEKTGYADFWTLRRLDALPTETQNYVPIILATALIAKDPQAYGFDVQPDPPLASEQVMVTVPTDLRLVAQLIGRPVEELIQLNPSLLRWTTPANAPEFLLHLPLGTKEAYAEAISMIPPDKRIWWRAHKVQENETLSTIAKTYRISTVALARVNQIPVGAQLEGGARLVVPQAPGKESSLVRVRERGPRRAYRYRVRSGDTLELIADRFDVTPYQIRRWNGLKSSRLLPGKTLKVYVATGTRGRSRGHGARQRAASSGKSLAKKKLPALKTPQIRSDSNSSPQTAIPATRATR